MAMNRFAALVTAGVSALAMASAANAADLIISEPVVGVVDTTGNWDGMFIGVFGGYGWGTATGDALGLFPTSGDGTLDLAGWLVGIDAGANFYVTDGIVAGIVGDIAWSDISGEDAAGLGAPTTASIDWVGSLRGRLGFDGGAFMPYLTGGLAVAGATVDDGVADTNTHVGWTVGAGVEIAATEELSIDLQYRYSDYGSQDYTLGGGVVGVDLTTHQVTAGLHWNF